jgi:hypothetical protein
MPKATRILLVLTSITLPLGVLFATGILNVDNAPGLYVTFPAGAILFGMYLIFRMMEGEVAAFDAEHKPPETPPAKTHQPESDYGHAGHSHGRA